ncbi:DDX25 helicase, partial [Todus mexicanus]|nr:DDX25 helicase [Todus mexicanus]
VDLAETSLLNKLIRTSLVESSHHVEILQQDPSSPLFSVKSFEELPLKKELLKGIYSMGFNRPSKIQEKALPIILAYPPQNLIAQSQSGTGKTAAFALAMLSRVNAAEKYPQCLCLAPTYELALQIGQVVEKIGQFCPDIKVTYAVRGSRVWQGAAPQEQIIIGTPGKAMDWSFKHRAVDLKKINLFVLDEADIMIDTQCLSYQSIRIQRLVLLMAEVPLLSFPLSEGIGADPREGFPYPSMLLFLFHIIFAIFRDVKKHRELLEGAQDLSLRGKNTSEEPSSVQTRVSADWLAVEMRRDGHQVAILTSELTVAQRADVIHRFRSGKEKVLIATNVCARGIDVQQVTVVVNFSLPTDHRRDPDFETYLHRIGRTGRFGKKGVAFSMVESRDLRLIHLIEEHFLTKIKQLDPNHMEELEDLEN